MTNKEKNKLKELELKAWNSYASAQNCCTDRNWVDCCRHNWFGIHTVLEEFRISPIRGMERMTLDIGNNKEDKNDN